MSYYSNQIIWDLDKKTLVQLDAPGVFAWDPGVKRHSHLVWIAGPQAGTTYVCEGGLTGAEYLMERGEIAPAKTC